MGALVGVLWWGCSGGGPEERSETVWDEEALPQDLAGPVVKMRFFSTEKRWFWVTGVLWRGCSGGGALVGVGHSKGPAPGFGRTRGKNAIFSIEKRWFWVTLRFPKKSKS